MRTQKRLLSFFIISVIGVFCFAPTVVGKDATGTLAVFGYSSIDSTVSFFEFSKTQKRNELLCVPGSLDPTFNGTGIVITSFGGGSNAKIDSYSA